MRNVVLRLVILFSACGQTLYAAVPTTTTFQARIIAPSGAPLEASNVNFRFTILDSAGTCSLYVEDFANVNMGSSQGIATFGLGTGAKAFPPTAVAMVDVFNNSATSFPCQAGGSYTPGPVDRRQVVMQFNDGSGWQTVPQVSINSVFYSNYANRAENLAGYPASDYLRPVNLPTCTGSQALSYDGTVFTCIAAGGGGGGGGGITSVTGTLPVMVAGSTSTPIVSMPQASVSASGYLSSADWSTFNAKASSTLNSGQLYLGSGDNTARGVNLSGDATLNNTGVMTLANSGVSAGTYGSVNAVPYLTVDAKGRITSASSGAYQYSTNVDKGVVQIGTNLTISSGVLSMTSSDITSALGFTPATSGTAYANGGNSFSADASLGLNDNYRLNLKTNNLNRVTIDAAGNVGIGTTSPSYLLHLQKTHSAGSGGEEQTMFVETNVAETGTPGNRTGLFLRTLVPNTNTTNLSDVRGLFAYTPVAGSGNVTEINGGRLYGEFNSSGTATEVNGVRMGAGASSGNVGWLNASHMFALNYGGNLTNMTGIYVETNNLFGTVANRYSILLKSPGGSATNDFGVYQEGAGQNNYFAGNVGIGTTTPVFPLHVQKDQNAATYGAVVNTSNGASASAALAVSNGSDAAGFGLAGTGAGRSMQIFTQGPGGIFIDAINASGDINFRTGAGSTPRVVITNSGNVGIGTTTPSEKLHVVGNLKVQGQAYSSAQSSSVTTPLSFEANSGNVMNWDAGAQTNVTVNLLNAKDGGNYTLVIRGSATGSTTINCYSDNGVTLETNSFMPSNSDRATTGSIYSILRVGNYCYISWSTGWP